MRRYALLLVACLAAGGCKDTSGPDWDQVREWVQEHRVEWEATRPASYTIVQEHDCYCEPQLLEPVLLGVAVAEGEETITSAEFVASGEAVPPEDWDLFPTIEAIYDLLDTVTEAGVPGLTIQFREDLPIPELVVIDYDSRSTLDDRFIRVTEYTAAVPE